MIKSDSAVAHFPVDSNFTLTRPNSFIETASREVEAGMLVILVHIYTFLY